MSNETSGDQVRSGDYDRDNLGSKGARSYKIRRENKAPNLLVPGVIISILLSLFLIVLLWHNILVFNHPGQQGVYWSRFFGGTSNRILGEGAHFKLPWDEIIQYDIRLQEYGGDLLVLSKDGMEMRVRWSMRYRPNSEILPLLHKKIGPDYASKVVIPEGISTLRQVLGNFRAEEIFSYDEASLIKELAATATIKFQDYPIILANIHILQLQLPDEMSQGIVKKLLYEQETLAYEFRLAAATAEKDRLKIEAEGLKQFEQISKIPILKWKGIDATVELAKSENSKIIVIGTDSQELPLLLNSGQ